jgi:hypothetical protein
MLYSFTEKDQHWKVEHFETWMFFFYLSTFSDLLQNQTQRSLSNELMQ